MQEQIETRLKDLARRAGLTGVPPAAVAAALVLCALAVVLAAWRWWPRGAVAEASHEPAGATLASASDPTDRSDATEQASGLESTDESSSASSTVFVHVVGAVRHPGMYELPANARVAEAVEAAGGLAGNAAQAGVNLARLVADGEQVVVPTLDEFAAGGAATRGTAGAAAGAQVGGAPGGLVNINTADVTLLDTLPGVGPSTAAKIVAEREANGPFASPEDLGRVAGIGPKKLEELKPRVSVK